MADVSTPKADEITPEINEDFASLLDESFGEGLEGRVVNGTIVAIDGDAVTIDVGLKSEGRVPLKEFGVEAGLNTGEKVDVYVERYEDRDGMIRLSRERARREEAWHDLEKAFGSSERVNGTIFGRVKGGFIVDLAGAVCRS